MFTSEATKDVSFFLVLPTTLSRDIRYGIEKENWQNIKTEKKRKGKGVADFEWKEKKCERKGQQKAADWNVKIKNSSELSSLNKTHSFGGGE